MLACPVALFPVVRDKAWVAKRRHLVSARVWFFPRVQDLASPSHFARQPQEVQRVVLLGIFYALNWYRELVNAFAAQLELPG